MCWWHVAISWKPPVLCMRSLTGNFTSDIRYFFPNLWIFQSNCRALIVTYLQRFTRTFWTTRLPWGGLKKGFFVVVVVLNHVVLVVLLGKFFEFHEKTFTALLAEQRVHEIGGIQTLSTKFMEINSVCPRNYWNFQQRLLCCICIPF